MGFFSENTATELPVNVDAFTAQIPFLELVEAQEVKKVRYKLLGGTPFAKTDIQEVRENEPWHAVDVLDDAVGPSRPKIKKAGLAFDIEARRRGGGHVQPSP